jgi:DNA-binding transcriptional ArsR family regulator
VKNSVNKNEALKCELVQLFGEQEENIETAAQCLKVMSHPSRLRILCALRGGEQTVQNLEYYTEIKQTTLSQHLIFAEKPGSVSLTS